MAFKIESNLLDACALAILNRGDTYGYEITQEMKKAVDVSESTLYPVLRRLQQNKLCFTYDQPYQGRNRRYYSITPSGRAKLDEYEKMWTEYRDAIESLLLMKPDPADTVESAGSSEEDIVAHTADSDREETVDITDDMETELTVSGRGEDDE